jgi:hypothetical protein
VVKGKEKSRRVVAKKTASTHIVDKIISSPGDNKIKSVTMHVVWGVDILQKPVRFNKMEKISFSRVRMTNQNLKPSQASQITFVDFIATRSRNLQKF